MAIVNEEDGFTQLLKLNVIDKLLVNGNEIVGITTTLSDGQVFKYDATTDSLVYAGATVDDITGQWTYDQAINVPAGTVNIGEVLGLSEGVADLVVVDRLKSAMAFSVNSDFDDSTGSSVPTYLDFGAPFVLNIQTDDSTVITTNPITNQLTGTVVAPDVRLIDRLTIRGNGAMTNFRVKITDNATGLALRYVPSKSDFNNGTGLTTIAGDNTFFLSAEGTDTPGNFFLGFTPFLIESGQVVDVELAADAIDLLGDAGGGIYLVAEAHDGPPVELAATTMALTEGSVLFADASGVITEDNANFFWDESGSRLGIGTNTPAHRVEIVGGNGHLAIRSPSGGTSKVLLEDENGIDKLDIAYNDASVATNISAVDVDLVIQTNAGKINITTVADDLILNNRTTVSEDGQTLTMRAVSTENVGIDLLDSGGTTKLEMFYNDTTDTVSVISAVDFTWVATDGALNFSVTGAGEDVNIDSGSGGIQMFADQDFNMEADNADLTLSANSTDVVITASNHIVLNDDVLLQSGTSTSDYLLTHHQDRLFFQAHDAGENALLALAAEDGDGTDAVGLEIFLLGNVDQTNNSERLEVGGIPSLFRIWSTKTGTGVVRDLNIGATLADPIQFIARATGATDINSENGEDITLDSDAGGITLDSGGGDITLDSGNGDIILDSDNVQIIGTGAGYDIEQVDDDLHISGKNADGIVEIFTASGGGTDTAGLSLFDVGVGSNKVNSERLELLSNLGEWIIRMRSTGTGVQRDLKIGSTQGDPVNFVALASGATSIGSEAGETLEINSGDDLTITKAGQMTILDDSTSTGKQSGLVIEQAGTGDAVLHFEISGVTDWAVGIDNSGDDMFVISPNANLSPTTSPIQILTTGEVGINKAPESLHILDIETSNGDVVRLMTNKNVEFTDGQSGNGNSTDMFWNRDNVGFNQSEFCLYNNNDNADTQRNFRMNFTNAGTVGGLNVHFNGDVGIGTLDNTTADALLHVLSADADTVGIVKVESTGTNAGETVKFVGDQDPDGTITGAGGNEYYRDEGATSGSYESLEATTGTNWFKRSLNPSDIIEIHNSSQFEALATAGTITITTDTVIILKTQVITTSVFDVSAGANLTIESIGNKELIYASNGTFITCNDGDVAILRIQVFAVAGGTLLDYQGDAVSAVDIRNVLFAGWTLGTVSALSTDVTGPLFNLQDAVIVNWDGGFVCTRLSTLRASNILVNQIDDVSINLPLFEVLGVNTDFDGVIFNLFGRLSSGETAVRIDPEFAETSRLEVAISAVTADDLFDTSGTSGSYTAVAASALAATVINSVSDTGGDALFSTGAAVPLVGQTIVISGFVTNTDYNGTFICTNTGPGVFEAADIVGTAIPFGTTEAGSVTGDGITVTATAHGRSNDDTLTLDSDLSTEYDGGYIIYNVQTNSFDVNAVFGSTQTGTWDTSGLSSTNPSVLSFNNPGQVDSKYIATAFVNSNSTANGAIVNNTFTDMVFGTGGSALIEGSTIERWKLVDELNGTFEYSGNEPFDGYISFDFTTASSGGTQQFRFKIVHDIGAGFVDLPDAVQGAAEVGANSKSLTKTFPMAAVKGDQFKPQITRDSGASGITTTFATFYATQ